MYRTLFALFFLTFVIGCASQQESDYAKLQGSWQVVAIEKSNVNFMLKEEKELLAMKFHFSGDQYTVKFDGGSERTVTYFLNTEKSPRQIIVRDSFDMDREVGIYKLEGNRRLTWVSRGVTDTPPTEFKSSRGPYTVCITLEKTSDTASN